MYSDSVKFNENLEKNVAPGNIKKENVKSYPHFGKVANLKMSFISEL